VTSTSGSSGIGSQVGAQKHQHKTSVKEGGLEERAQDKGKARLGSFNYHGLMKKKLGLAFGCLWLATPLVLAQTTKPEPVVPSGLAEAKAAQAAAPSSLLDSALFYQLLVGEITLHEGEPAAGFALMLDAARKTGDAQLYQRATEIALKSRSGEAALQAARAWKQEQPASREANRYVLQILIALNRIADTVEPLKTEIRLAPDVERASALAIVPNIYARASDKKLASTVVEGALVDALNNPATASAAWTTVGRMRLAASGCFKCARVVASGQASDSLTGSGAGGPALLALELMDQKLPEAEGLVQKYLEGHAKAWPEIRMGYARVLLDLQRYAEATAQLQIVTREKPDFPAGWLVLGSLQLQDNQLAQAQTSLERYVALAQQQTQQGESKSGLAQAYLSLSQLAEKRKDYAAAENWLNKIENSSDLALAQTRRASILASQGKLEEGRQLIRQLPERSPGDARLKLNAEVSLLRDFKQYQLAHDLLAQALEKTPDEPDLLYDQAMMAEKLGFLDELERQLRRIIQLKPDYYQAYNALGYSLADRNVRLPEAKELIQKALEYAPSDPFIRDSLGWVEFRMGNTSEALQIFEAAYKAKPDAEIAAHFGEVLWSLGQRERAVAIWKEGQLINPDDETLLETLKRLRVKL
jgi:tetratricopeptide (TPR) repeat protein